MYNCTILLHHVYQNIEIFYVCNKSLYPTILLLKSYTFSYSASERHISKLCISCRNQFTRVKFNKAYCDRPILNSSGNRPAQSCMWRRIQFLITPLVHCNPVIWAKQRQSYIIKEKDRNSFKFHLRFNLRGDMWIPLWDYRCL